MIIYKKVSEGKIMELVINRILKQMQLDEGKWSQMQLMKMRLGFEVLFHNIFMISFVLATAAVCGIFFDALILLFSYGLLKLTVGGIHFKKSSVCLISTSAFVIFGTRISRIMNISMYTVLLIYIICLIFIWLIGPQGTKNNPISPRHYNRLKWKAVMIVSAYLLITIYKFMTENRIPYLLLVAVTFETISILPNIIKNRCC